MHSFFVDPAQLLRPAFDLSSEDSRHAAGSLRLRPGEKVVVNDGRGGRVLAKIVEATNRRTHVEVIERINIALLPYKIVLLQGVPKAGKLDLIVEKSTELGVDEVIPVICERTIVSYKGEKADQKRDRWQRIAEGAARQCGRPTIPVIHSPLPFHAAIDTHAAAIDRFIIPWEERAATAGPITSRLLAEAKSVAVLIGPEGGLSEDEVDYAQRAKPAIVSLGPTILRTETAAVAAITLVGHFLREINPELYHD